MQLVFKCVQCLEKEKEKLQAIYRTHACFGDCEQMCSNKQNHRGNCINFPATRTYVT